MHRMNRLGVLLTLFCVALATGAHAQAPEAPGAGASGEAPGRWSFGGGVGLGGYESGLSGLSGAGALGGLGGLRAPVGVALLERTLSPALRLGVNLSGSYARSDVDESGDAPGVEASTSHSSRVGGGVSLRWVLNPGQLVEVSPMAALGGAWLRAEAEARILSYSPEGDVTVSREQDSDGWGVDGRLGLVVEYRLLSRLYLRLESHFARVGFDHQRLTTRDVAVDRPTVNSRADMDTFSVSFGFQPFLQLRIVL
jgi:hypothetical protein